MGAAAIALNLEQATNKPIKPEVLYDLHTINELADHLECLRPRPVRPAATGDRRYLDCVRRHIEELGRRQMPANAVCGAERGSWYEDRYDAGCAFTWYGCQAMADRYTYVPYIGLFIAVTWGIAGLAAAWRIPKWALAGTAGVGVAVREQQGPAVPGGFGGELVEARAGLRAVDQREVRVHHALRVAGGARGVHQRPGVLGTHGHLRRAGGASRHP